MIGVPKHITLLLLWCTAYAVYIQEKQRVEARLLSCGEGRDAPEARRAETLRARVRDGGRSDGMGRSRDGDTGNGERTVGRHAQESGRIRAVQVSKKGGRPTPKSREIELGSSPEGIRK